MPNLSSTFIFKPAINYDGDRVTQRSTTTVIHAMTDNDYTTFSSVDDVDIDVSSGGNATRIDCIALKTKNVDSYAFTPTGGTGTGFANRAIPTEYTTADGRAQTSIVNGFQHEIYLLPSPVTATGVRLQFSGTNIEVYAVMLLELVMEIPDGEFVSTVPRKVDRAGIIHDFPDGSVDRGSVLGAERWKWEREYRLKVVPGRTSQTSVASVLRILADNTEIVHMQEPSRYPDRWYPAAQVLLSKPTPLRTKQKQQGHTVRFEVAEA